MGQIDSGPGRRRSLLGWTIRPSGRSRRRRVVCLRSGLRPSLRHTTRTVPQLTHKHWYKNWGGAKTLTQQMESTR